jgi:hypothetical protein
MHNLNPFAAALRFKPEKERRFPRHLVDFGLSLKVWRGGAFLLLEGRANDLCEGGLAFTTELTLQVGETVHLEVVLPHSDYPLMLAGVVRHRQGMKYGVELIGLRAQQRTAILRFCDTLANA